MSSSISLLAVTVAICEALGRKLRGVERWHRLVGVSVVGGALSIAGGYLLGELEASYGWVLAFAFVMILAANLLTVPYYIKRRAENGG